MSKFLYVYTRRDRDNLLRLDYFLLKADEEKEVYVFENNGRLSFDKNKIAAVPSDVLIF